MSHFKSQRANNNLYFLERSLSKISPPSVLVLLPQNLLKYRKTVSQKKEKNISEKNQQ